MGEKAKPDFSGWATKAGLKCSDGRTIMEDAFKHQDQVTVPLVWQHTHTEPANVLGHAVLEHREGGVYTYGYFNDTEQAKHAKTLVQHKDITSLSIYANQLTEKAKNVIHGFIREVSLVLSGANPGALIDNITLAHSDGEMVTLDDEAIIYTGLELTHGDEEPPNEDIEHADDEVTIQEVYDAMSDEQKEVVHYMVGTALAERKKELEQAQKPGPSDLSHKDDDKEGRRMTRNVFEQQNGGKQEETHVLTHDAIKGIVADAEKCGSLKEAVEAYALKHGIDNIEVLFPDARTLSSTPEFDSRRVEWVSGVLNGTRHSPFSRIKQITADITFDEARAMGYVKGNLKKEEYFGVATRSTTPSTIYKKQKLDRDDIIDITDFDVVAWLKAEMRLMLDEELARAILVGDGRDVSDEDKIKDPAGAAEGAGIRSILNEHELYAATITVDDSATPDAIVDAFVGGMGWYKGSGSPTFYTTLPFLSTLLVHRDQDGHRLWRTKAELASEMGVANIVEVEVMEGIEGLLGIIVNLKDYTVGADKGGDVAFFDDFDIDYNQYKYLLETRVSGALTKIRSAVIVRQAASGGTLVDPAAPTFDGEEITIVDTTGVVYKRGDTDATVTSASAVAVDPGETLRIYATPASGYYFASNQEDEWYFENENPA